MNILKSYLISLGYALNKTQFNQLRSLLDDLGRMLTSLAKNLAKSIGQAAILITSLLTSATLGIAAFIESVARADLQTQLWARRMWITEGAARSLQQTLKALGYEYSDRKSVV